jgi:hypothetical protein
MGTNITGIGNANAIGFKSRVTGGMYFPPELKDALVGVWSAYGKSNDSTDRNIIKNKIKDRGGDFELINFNYEGTSGYNGYPVVFGKDKTYQYVNHSPNYNQTTINVTHFNTRQALLYSYIQRNGELTSYNRDYPSYKIKVSGLEEGFGLMYQYNSKADATSVNALRIETNGIYTIPKSFASDGSLTNANIWVGFVFTGTEQEQCNVTIEVLPEYKGAVVTDGVDDMIISTKTVSEMLEGSNEVTVISMIRQIKNSPDSIIRNNWMFRPEYYLENRVSDESIGKSGIYGYTSSNISGAQVSVINNILGDKNDYTGNSKIESTSLDYFSVEGFRHSDGNMWYLSQVAWYWTFIAKRVLTEDEINLVIEKYNLDRPGEVVKPDVYYDIKRQKINNENHSSFDDELTDFSGNGHNMKLYNIAWEGNSGIGNYPVVFGANKTWKNLRAEDNNLSYKLIANSITVYKVLPNSGAIMWTYIKENEIIREIEIPSFTVKVSGTKNGDRVRYYYVDENSTFKNTIFDITEDGTYVLPKCNKLQITESTPSTNIFIGFAIILNDNPSTGVTIEVIPSNENTICLDGVDDYGKVTGLPIYKDYTVAALRKWLFDDSVTSTQTGSIVSKSKFGSDGAFIFEQTLNKNPSRSSTWCFGLTNSLINNDKLFEESFTYQTKYSYNNNPIQPGTGFDRDSMWLGSVRDNDSRYSKMAIWSLLLFPYSLSEFLLERQIKKARAGTLYPNQVEFRPIIPEDENITRIDYFVVNSGTWTVIKPGDYVDVGARIVFNVYTKLPYKVEKVSSPAFTGMNVRHSTELNIFDVEGYIKDKTPQKIKLTLAVNEDIVQWNPTITSNLLDSFTASSWYLNGWDNTITTGTWIKKTDRVFFKATFKTELYGLETATFGGAECVVSKADNWSDSKNIWDIRMLGTVGDLSQVFNLDVYELIRFEDIVQPYPSFYEFIDENKNLITWGSKIKVGSTITRTKGFFDSNLLKGLYTISYPKLNGVEASGSKYVVEKSMVFTCTATWIFDNNEPKCVLSPDRLQIPNSSYRILKHIPDISGHGNHGKINNSAYEGMSGMNGYPVVFGANKTWKSIVANNDTPWNYKLTPTSINIYKSDPIGSFFIRTYIILNGVINSITIPEFKIKVSNLKDGEIVQYHYVSNDNNSIVSSVSIRTNGIHILPASVPIVTEDVSANKSIGFTFKLNDNINEDGVTIEILPKYEGSFCLDGVDDFVTIPTLVTKQSLIKCNWTTQNYNKFLVDYRKDNASNGYSTNKTGSTDIQLAYNGRVTYIDGILNKNLIPDDNLKGITHCVTIQYPNNVESETTIASAFDLRSYMQMALYTYIAFSEFSTEEKIKELNEYVGTEGNIVEWNPTITSNIPYKDISTYITTDGTTDLSPKVGNLYKKGDKLTIGIKPAKDLDEVGTVTVNGVKVKRSSLTELGYYIYDTVLDSTQIIDITIDEYIKYEDIVQPFPTIFELKNVDTNVTYTYGSKLKIGSEFLFDKWTNLLPELYRPTGSGRYNGNEFKIGNTYIVERTMTFSWSSPMEYLLDSEPKCIFSPSKLRMPNESYRYLGYIPDISGNGNNGVFNNFAFGGMSGVDGYPFNFRTITVLVKKVSFTDDTLVINRTSTSDQTWVLNLGKQSESFDLYVNWEDDSTRLLVWAKNGIIVSQYTLNKEWNSIPVVTDDYDYIYLSYINPSTLGKTTIKQKAKYEGSICFDGVDDYITIPTLSEGGKQVLMKVNWQKQDTMLYNQNPGQDNFAIFTNDYNNNNLVVAYASRNNGNTYIDGVVNNNILATQLKGITHNIVATNNNIDATITPIIGSNKNHDNFFAQMALYDFMLFDEISTDEEIKELNNIVGIEGDYVQKPSYYWDAYGKSNLDVDKGYIKDQVSLQLNNDTTNNNSLENFNFGYEGMSGYNGYPVIFGANKTWKNKAPEGPNSYICTINANKYNITQILLSNAWTYSYIKENGELTKYNKDVESFKIKVTGLKSEIPLRYSYLSSTDATVTSNITIKSDGTYELPKSFANDGSLIDNYGWIGFSFTRISVDIPEIITDVNITIEILPEYKNGLVYDGVDDYSENASIPLLSDYTYIFKRTLLNKKYNSASIFKGSNQQSGGGAFICDYNSVEPDLLTQGYSFGAGLYVDSLNADSIVYGTRGSVNGTKITAGNNTDTEGLTVGKWRAYKEMVFYKLFLYPRTVNMLSINMVKNMMEEDGIIDLTSKLFTDKYTGDFYEMDFNNDFLIGN